MFVEWSDFNEIMYLIYRDCSYKADHYIPIIINDYGAGFWDRENMSSHNTHEHNGRNGRVGKYASILHSMRNVVTHSIIYCHYRANF
jgi:hypothetical protein